MQKALALVVASLALLAGSSGALAAAPSGISGTVTKGPISPVCREGVPCSAPAAGYALVFLRGGVRVKTATTPKKGTYRVVLAPGTYVVRSLGASRFGGLPPHTVRVRAGRFTVANLKIDTGIR